MLSIIVVSQKGEGYELAQKLAQLGHLVKWSAARLEPANPKTQTGFRQPQAVNQYEKHLETADLLVLLNSRGVVGRSSQLGASGALVLGGGVEERLCLDKSLSSSWKLVISQLRLAPNMFLGGSFNGREFVGLVEGFQQTRLLDKNKGPILQPMGATIWSSTQTNLDALIPLLQAINFKGFFGVETDEHCDLNFVIGFSNLWFKAYIELLKEVNLAEYVYQLASGELELTLEDKFAIAIQVLAYSNLDLKLEARAAKHIWIGQDPGAPIVVTSLGEDIREARRRVYRTVDLNLPIEAIYRTDIGFLESDNEK